MVKKMRKVLATILALSMCMGMLSIPAMAANTTGSGTPEDPYVTTDSTSVTDPSTGNTTTTTTTQTEWSEENVEEDGDASVKTTVAGQETKEQTIITDADGNVLEDSGYISGSETTTVDTTTTKVTTTESSETTSSTETTEETSDPVDGESGETTSTTTSEPTTTTSTETSEPKTTGGSSTGEAPVVDITVELKPGQTVSNTGSSLEMDALPEAGTDENGNVTAVTSITDEDGNTVNTVTVTDENGNVLSTWTQIGSYDENGQLIKIETGGSNMETVIESVTSGSVTGEAETTTTYGDPTTTTVTGEPVTGEPVTGEPVVTEGSKESGNYTEETTTTQETTQVTTETTVQDRIETTTQETTNSTTTVTKESSSEYSSTEESDNRKVTASLTEAEVEVSETTSDLETIENTGSTYNNGTKKQDVGFDSGRNGASGKAPEGYDLYYAGYNEYSGFKVGYKTEKNATGTASPMQLELMDPDTGEVHTVYCVDLGTNTQNGWWYTIENLENAGYYSDEEANNIRAIVDLGYWGTENDPQNAHDGSLADLKATLAAAKAAGDKNLANINIDDLTEGEALTATQMAIWTYGNSAGDYDLYANNGSNSEKNRINAVAAYLASQSQEATEENSTTVITEENFIDSISLTVGDKAEHENNNDADATNDAYNTEVTVSLVVQPSSITGSLKAHMVVNGEVVETWTLATSTTDEGDQTAIHPDENGNYILSGTMIENEDVDFEFELEGTQELTKGVYIYTSEVRTTYSVADEIANRVDREIEDLKRADDLQNKWGWITGNDESELDSILEEYGTLEAYEEYLTNRYLNSNEYKNKEDQTKSSQTFVGVAQGERAVNVTMSATLTFSVDEGTVSNEWQKTEIEETTTEVVSETVTETTVKTTPETTVKTITDVTTEVTVDTKKVETTTETESTSETKEWEDSWKNEYEPEPKPEPTPDPVIPTPIPTPTPVEIPEEDPPLVEIPEEEPPLEEIPEEDIPLADVPKTGDVMGLWMALSLLSGGGLIVLSKKREEEEV